MGDNGCLFYSKVAGFLRTLRMTSWVKDTIPLSGLFHDTAVSFVSLYSQCQINSSSWWHGTWHPHTWTLQPSPHQRCSAQPWALRWLFRAYQAHWSRQSRHGTVSPVNKLQVFHSVTSSCTFLRNLKCLDFERWKILLFSDRCGTISIPKAAPENWTSIHSYWFFYLLALWLAWWQH